MTIRKKKRQSIVKLRLLKELPVKYRPQRETRKFPVFSKKNRAEQSLLHLPGTEYNVEIFQYSF